MESSMAISSIANANTYSIAKSKPKSYTSSDTDAYSITDSEPYANAPYTSYWSDI
jgi:hypothetical protein